jgi:hypothetical protein
MSKVKLFLYDFTTNKKIIKYAMAIVLLFAFALYFRTMNQGFTIGSVTMANIGLTTAFMTTLYSILSYATLDRIKAYLMLPCRKAEVFFAFVFAEYFSLVLERISFVIVIAALFTKEPFLLAAYLTLSSLIAVILDTVIVMSLNKRKILFAILSVALILLLCALLTFSQYHIVNFSLLSFSLFIGIIIISRFEPKHLAINRESRIKKNLFRRYNYFFTVMMREKTAFINTVCIFVFAIAFTFIANSTPILLYAIWCIFAVNTPVTTMFSGDKALMRQEKMLPHRSRLMSGIYVYFLSAYFVIANAFAVLLFIIVGQFSIFILFTGVMLVVIETGVTILLERKYPIRAWQKKQEVWRNPRKYILPLIVFAVAVIPILADIR